MPPTCPFERPLDQYLDAVGRGLWAVGPGRRRQILRTLRADLLDLAEDRGLREADALEAFLRDQPAPRTVARALQKGELDRAFGRILLALVPMVLAGLWTVVSTPNPANTRTAFLIQQAVWYGAVTYLHFALRIGWAHQREPVRLLWGLLLGATGGFLWFALSLRSWPEFLALQPFPQAFSNMAGRWILTGIILGVLVERVASRKRWWVLALDAPLCFFLFLGWVNAYRPLPPQPRDLALLRSFQALNQKEGPRVRWAPRTLTRPGKPNPYHFIPTTLGLQAMLWAGVRTSRRLKLLRLFRQGKSSGGGLSAA